MVDNPKSGFILKPSKLDVVASDLTDLSQLEKDQEGSNAGESI